MVKAADLLNAFDEPCALLDAKGRVRSSISGPAVAAC